ncbi:unnamed protein product [Mesocestoides corti]|uniref:BRO1 domain-containing protein n=1 Tax=Mesocestoides corti TaxID=53468 RepID=A0A0R3UG00_MESCO|nr:unnamed protein product [Mesocestoides corti]
MAQWFHRNPMKASGRPNFDLGPVTTSISARMLCSQLSDKRQRLITMFGDFTASSDSVIDAANQYISLLMGLATSPDSGNFAEHDEETEEDSDSEVPQAEGSDSTELTKKDKKKMLSTKLRSRPFNVIICDFTIRTMRDANFELVGILYNLGLWLSKHAAKIASNNDIEMEQAVEVYKSLRNAAGVFHYIKSNLLKQIKGEIAKGSDLDPNVLEAYILQSLAEAQEVTIARAMELKHDPGIIAALASETAIMYEKCKLIFLFTEFGLQNVPDALVTKWRAYCIFKAACFRAYVNGIGPIDQGQMSLSVAMVPPASPRECYYNPPLCSIPPSLSALERVEIGGNAEGLSHPIAIPGGVAKLVQSCRVQRPLLRSRSCLVSSCSGVQLETLSRQCVGRWVVARQLAHCFYSESQLKADHCGVAIVSAQEALKYCAQAQNAAKVYRSGSGAEYVFIRRLQPYAQRTLTKAQTENAMIYHQKVPASMPQLQLKPDYGVATPELPAGLSFSVDESWQEAMPGFDLTKVPEWISRKDYQAKKKEAAKLHTVPETPIYQGDRDPNNESGCVIS